MPCRTVTFITTEAAVLWRRNDLTTARLEQHQGQEIERGAVGALDPGH